MGETNHVPTGVENKSTAFQGWQKLVQVTCMTLDQREPWEMSTKSLRASIFQVTNGCLKNKGNINRCSPINGHKIYLMIDRGKYEQLQ